MWIIKKVQFKLNNFDVFANFANLVNYIYFMNIALFVIHTKTLKNKQDVG